ncbi:MAG TPA: hypothetical protein G4O11_11570 [Anaerolineae bacterium]|nr:hypothetical protein [Anaerolineae bacterium]
MARKKRDIGRMPGKKTQGSEHTASLQCRQLSQAADGVRNVADQPSLNGYNIRTPTLTLSKVLVLLLIVTWLHGCIEIRSRDVYRRAPDPNEYRNEEDVRKDVNLHRGRWWNYYERGSDFLAAGHHGAALKDFETAIKKRDGDTRDARTYGMHFVDYFPHRESGIAYYFQGELEASITEKEKLFKKAMKELQISIGQAPSSKAMFYLKRATMGFWSVTQEDVKPPVVWIENDAIDRWEDVPTLYIDGHAVALEIRASDDQSRVGKVFVDDERLFVESVREPFEAEPIVTVKPDANERTVVVKAVDLAGNESWPVSVRLVVDTAPPTGAIRFLPERTALSGGRIHVEITAVDDRSLKSVQFGKEPYNKRDCRGERIWKGEFSAELGVHNLAVEITDQAGHVTDMNVTLKPEQVVAGTGRGERLFAYDTSLGHGQNRLRVPFDITLQGSGNILRPLVLFSTLEIHSAPPLLGYQRVQVAGPSVSKPPELLFPEFDFTSEPLSASGDSFLLQGEITNTRDYQLQRIVVNDKEIKQEALFDEVDHRSFNTWVPLPACDHPDCNQIQLIKVHAYFKHVPTGEIRTIKRTNLKVKRVPDSPWIGDSLYSVILLPLEDADLQQSKASDFKDWPSKEHRDASDWVKAAVVQYESLTDSHESHRRFDCNDLDRWKLVQADQKLWDYYREEEGKPRTRTRTTVDWELAQRASDLAEAYATDLGIYGLFNLEGGEIEIKIGFTRVKSDGEHLLPQKWIDVYGVRNDREHFVKGLVSKLKIWMPRISGQIHDIRQDGTIEVELGQQRNVFKNMDLLLYDVSGSQDNPCYEEKCIAQVNDMGILDQFAARVVKCSSGESWASLFEQWKDVKGVRVMSK